MKEFLLLTPSFFIHRRSSQPRRLPRSTRPSHSCGPSACCVTATACGSFVCLRTSRCATPRCGLFARRTMSSGRCRRRSCSPLMRCMSHRQKYLFDFVTCYCFYKYNNVCTRFRSASCLSQVCLYWLLSFCLNIHMCK